MGFGVAHIAWAAPAFSFFLSLKAAPVVRRGLFFGNFPLRGGLFGWTRPVTP